MKTGLPAKNSAPHPAELRAFRLSLPGRRREDLKSPSGLPEAVRKPPNRPRATELVQEILDELRPATRKLEPGTARDIMRSYGVTAEALEGEIQVPGDVPVAPVNLAAP